MLLALDWEAIIYVASMLELVHQRDPDIFALSTIHERVGISDQYHGISSAR